MHLEKWAPGLGELAMKLTAPTGDSLALLCALADCTSLIPKSVGRRKIACLL